MSTKESKMSFFDQVLSTLNKNDADIQKEQLEDKIEDFKIDCETEISLLESNVIPVEKAVTKRLNKIVKAKQKHLEAIKLNVLNHDTFASYINALNEAEIDLAEAKEKIQESAAKIVVAQDQKKAYKALLTMFNRK